MFSRRLGLQRCQIRRLTGFPWSRQQNPTFVNTSLGSCQSRSHATLLAEEPHHNDMFLSGNSANYIDEMYVQWRQSPSSVHISWQTYFRNMEQGLVPSYEAFQPPPGFISNPPQARSKYNTVALHEASEGFDRIVRQGAKLQELIQAYRIHGHEKANLDPLGIRGLCDGSGSTLASDLDFRQHGFAESEMEQEFAIGSQILPTLDFGGRKTMKLREIINFCERTYCGNYAVEFYHIPDRKKRAWILNRVEVENPISYTKAEKRRILDRLVWSASFEHFLATKFPNEKRYGLEGGESFTPGVKALIDASAEHGVEDIVIGSQHRGRLSLLANLVRKPMEEMFQEFSLGGQPSHPTESGDVKTHLGMDYVRTCPSGHKVRISLLANPSHLEADDPVAAGKAKAIQHFTKDKDMSKTMCLTFHGDAAVSGQGIVYETLNLSNVPAFTTGGTIHVIVNNQIGFTTDPEHSRSTMYCSDIAKANGAPVFHVNADDVEAVVFVSKLAADWRATFKSDVFIDLICYRKFGHNEMDQPMFTQPFMYDKVTKKTPVLDIYTNKLVQESSFSPKEIQEHKQTIWEQMTQKFEASKDYRRQNIEWMTSSWPSVKSLEELATTTLSAKPTAIDETTYTRITDRIDAIPEDFSMHRNVAKALYARSESLRGGSSIDWTTAESLAFGSLLMEGTHVRLSGQDVERGTFSQRHAVLHNQNFAPNTDKIQKWVPLDHLTEQQARFTIHNSPLSEYGVLGFEYGYSLASPDALVQWEAQFGDFANTAQVIVDQYLSGGEAKWLSSSGLVLSLPHGYDGQGPEHSSARLERFLQLCNGDSRVYPPPDQLGRLHQDCNLQVVYMTTPANLFHVLRRQIHRDYRKPLVIFFSKSLLRHPLTKSRRADFLGNSSFQHMIPDPEHGNTIDEPQGIRKVILCSGQVYAALFKHRAENGSRDIAVTRIEQLHPFPWRQVKENLDMYPHVEEIVWCQEEPMNAGAWQYVQSRLQTVLGESKHHGDRQIQYVGRDPSSATATGFKSVHDQQAKELMKAAFAKG